MNEQEQKPSCGTCKFSRTYSDDEVRCHRYPPQSTPNGRFFPKVFAEDSCGEYVQLTVKNKLPTSNQIKLTLERFDFAKVANAMEETGWKWRTDYGMCVPSKQQIKDTALKLIGQIDEDTASVSSGGLTAELNDGHLYLYFVLESSNSEVD